MELIEEKLKGGVYDNYLVSLDERVSYSINILNKNEVVDEDNVIDSENLVLLLNAIASIMKSHPHINIFNKGDEICIGNVNLEFVRRYIQIDENDFTLKINYEFK
jgi:hypothetical protein